MDKQTDDSLPTTKSTPERPPLKLLDLDDDCLLHIMGFLKLTTHFSLRFTNSRFIPLFRKVARNGMDRFILDLDIARKFPPKKDLEFYRAIGEVTENLHVYHIREDDMILVLPCFEQLNELYFRMYKMTNVAAIASFPSPKELYLDAGETEKTYLNALLKKFSATLKVLHCHKAPRADIGIVPKIKELSVSALWLAKKSNFWRNNTTLEILYVINERVEEFLNFDLVKENFKAIAAIPSLERLDLRGIQLPNMKPSIMPQFTRPTMVELEFIGEDLLVPVLQKMGPQLQILLIKCKISSGERGPEILQLVAKLFPKLETLILWYPYVFLGDWELEPLRSYKCLKQLALELGDEDCYLEVFKNIPTLEVLINNGVLKVNKPQALLDWAKAVNRNVEIEPNSDPEEYGCYFF